MKTIETTALVGPDRKMTVQLPPEITPGEHRIVVTIHDVINSQLKSPPLQFSAYPVKLASDAFTFRREDLYDDTGR